MENVTLAQSKRAKTLNYLKKNWWLYAFVLPTIIWYIVFHYVPMGGIVIAFKRYTGVQTIWESRWVGMKWFTYLFTMNDFWYALKNTLILAVSKMVLTTLASIAFALLIYAGLDGIDRQLMLPASDEINLYEASAEQLAALRRLPQSHVEAMAAAQDSTFVHSVLPKAVITAYCPI